MKENEKTHLAMLQLGEIIRRSEGIGVAHEKLERGMVWCRTCGQSQMVDSKYCLRNGWPKCCGETMTIDSPDERKSQ